MASTVVFDMADPGIKKVVDSWADNTEYSATITVRTGTGEQRNVAEVTEFTPEESTDMETEAPAAKAPAKEPAMKVEY